MWTEMLCLIKLVLRLLQYEHKEHLKDFAKFGCDVETRDLSVSETGVCGGDGDNSITGISICWVDAAFGSGSGHWFTDEISAGFIDEIIHSSGTFVSSLSVSKIMKLNFVLDTSNVRCSAWLC